MANEGKETFISSSDFEVCLSVVLSRNYKDRRIFISNKCLDAKCTAIISGVQQIIILLQIKLELKEQKKGLQIITSTLATFGAQYNDRRTLDQDIATKKTK